MIKKDRKDKKDIDKKSKTNYTIEDLLNKYGKNYPKKEKRKK